MFARVVLLAMVFLSGLLGAQVTSGRAESSTPWLGAHGIGAVRFGLSKTTAIADLRALFGAPTARGVNTGCGARYTEVEWHDLIAEFRLGRFAGYRYVLGGWPLTTIGSPRAIVVMGVAPQLVTRSGITLGATLADTRHAYGELRFIGVARWRTSDGLELRADDSSPRRIVEIQIGTCGDF